MAPYSMKITNNSVITFRRLQSSVTNLRVNCRLNCRAGVVSVDSARLSRERIINSITDSCFSIHDHVMHVGLVWRVQNKFKSCSSFRQGKTSQSIISWWYITKSMKKLFYNIANRNKFLQRQELQYHTITGFVQEFWATPSPLGLWHMPSLPNKVTNMCEQDPDNLDVTK